MKISRWATYAVGVLAAASLIAGCSGNGAGGATQPSSVSAPNSVSPSGHAGGGPGGGMMPLHRGLQDTFIGMKRIGKVHPDHHKSWISPAAMGAPRLYFASDADNGDVYIYLLPSFKLVGTLTGFSQPQGECSDTHGNIYIANTNTFQILEYSRTGTLLNTYTDTYGYPVGCAVDPATGNVAATDIFGFYGAGQVVVWPGGNPSSTPYTLSNPNQYFYYFAGYGPGTDLWVSGRDPYGNYMLSGCNTSTCSTIPISGGTIYFPGAVQWDNVRSQWVAFDQLCNGTNEACSYPVSESGVLGSQTMYLNYNGGGVCDLIQGVIAANGKRYVAGGDYEYCYSASTTFNRWAYPGGGTPTNYTNDPGLYPLPVGAAISTK